MSSRHTQHFRRLRASRRLAPMFPIPLQSHQAKGQGFLELSKVTCWLYAVAAARQSSRSRDHHHGRTIWTEPVRYWRKACRLACLNHTVLLQIIMGISPTLYSIIVIADDPQGKKRPRANNTSPHGRRMSSLSICYKCLTLDN